MRINFSKSLFCSSFRRYLSPIPRKQRYLLFEGHSKEEKLCILKHTLPKEPYNLPCRLLPN